MIALIGDIESARFVNGQRCGFIERSLVRRAAITGESGLTSSGQC
jgi:hypothetical protein